MFRTRKDRRASRLEDLFDQPDEPLPSHLRHDHLTFLRNRPSRVLLALLPVADRLTMRTVSKIAANWIDQDMARTFQWLYIAPAKGPISLSGLAFIGSSCTELVIRLEKSRTEDQENVRLSSGDCTSVGTAAEQVRPRASDTHASPESAIRRRGPSTQSESSTRTESSGQAHQCSSPTFSRRDPRFWVAIYRHLPNLITMTISVPGDPGWCGYQETEAIITAIRIAIEQSTFPHLTTLRLDPIHAMGLLHFRWAGGGAWGDASWYAGSVWRRINTIEINLTNPFTKLSKSKSKMLRKVLHDWLASFATSLETLRFSWIDGEGPNPLALDLSAKEKDFSAPGIRWRVLEELELGNVQLTPVAVAVLKDRAKGLKRLFVQDPFFLGTFSDITWRHGLRFHAVILELQEDMILELQEDEETLDSDKLVEEGNEQPNEEADEQGKEEAVSEDEDALSDTSLEVPFMLQL